MRNVYSIGIHLVIQLEKLCTGFNWNNFFTFIVLVITDRIRNMHGGFKPKHLHEKGMYAVYTYVLMIFFIGI